MGLMSAVASSTLTALTGGSEKEIQEAFFAGYFAGIGLGMLMCAVVIINVAALLSTAALVFAGVNFVALSILTIYSEAVGDSQRALTYASLIAVAYIGTCEYLNVSGEATVTGSKGTAKISTKKIETKYSLNEALEKLNDTGVRPGQTEISEKRVWEIVNDYNSLKAQSSIYIDKGGHYIVDGHHTTVANTMLGRGTEINMNMYTQQPPSATDIYWSKKWYEIGKRVIKVTE